MMTGSLSRLTLDLLPWYALIHLRFRSLCWFEHKLLVAAHLPLLLRFCCGRLLVLRLCLVVVNLLLFVDFAAHARTRAVL
jgi:hypothetical protein